MTGDDRETARARADRERRRRQVFGDVLDGSTLDDRPEASEVTPATTGSAPVASDRWLQENVPPHHGG